MNTGAGCHLDATMVHQALQPWRRRTGPLVFVENVGNLVCPALFDIGEHARIVVISVTEGDDKPIKYPHMFAAADVVVVNKTDLLPYVDFDLDRLDEAGPEPQPRGHRAPDVVCAPARTSGPGWTGWRVCAARTGP